MAIEVPMVGENASLPRRKIKMVNAAGSRRRMADKKRKAKFKVGRVVGYSVFGDTREHFMKIEEINWHLCGSSGREQWLYESSEGDAVWQERVRPLTKRERGGE